MKTSIVPWALMALACAPLSASFAAATEPVALVKPEASIAFGRIRDWQSDSERGMWIQAYNRQWYYAEFMGRCLGLNFATAVGFDTRHQSSFDRFSSVFVPGYGRCVIQTFTQSDGPPRKKRKTDKSSESNEGGKSEELNLAVDAGVNKSTDAQ